jgi:hypothetical protein
MSKSWWDLIDEEARGWNDEIERAVGLRDDDDSDDEDDSDDDDDDE